MTEISSFLAPGGNTDNAPLMPALIADMAANPGETYTAKRGQVFRFDAGGFVFPNGVRLRTEGARFDIGASIGGAAFFNFGDDLDADHLNIRALGGCLVKRAVTIGARARVSEITAKSDDQQANFDEILDAAVRLIGSDTDVGFIDVENFDQAVMIYGDGHVGPNKDTIVRRSRITSFRRGIQARNCDTLTLRDTVTRMSSPNGTMDPGQNSILFDGVKDGKILGATLDDAPEHGVRLGGWRDVTAGLPNAVKTRGTLISDVTIRGAKQCGLKIWTETGIHEDVTLNAITVIDCGDGGNGYGFNDFGFMFQAINGLRGSNLCVTRRDKPYSAKDGMFLHGLTDAVLGVVQIIDPIRNAIRVSEFSDDTSLNPMSTNGLDIPSPYLSGHQQEAVVLNFTGSGSPAIRDVKMSDMHIMGGTDGVRANASASKFKQRCYFSALARGYSGTLFALPGSPDIKTAVL